MQLFIHINARLRSRIMDEYNLKIMVGKQQTLY